jgi:ATPase subunit of ABC transporter with duplicated ATPase domains
MTSLNLIIPPAPRLGSEVISFTDVTKSFEDKLLIEKLSFKLPPGGIIGIIGANGAGKTTLFKLITSQETPDSGKIIIGDTVDLNYVDQSRDALKPSENIWESISDGLDEIQIGKRTIQSRAYVGQFNFKGSDQQKIVSQLSGGERNRVHLAKILKNPGNVLLLDEPTNDLDVDTLRALEEAIINFSGCVVVISHDRWFLNKIATHILAFEGSSHVEWFEGNYQDYEADKKRRLGEEALNPKRIKYKPISR